MITKATFNCQSDGVEIFLPIMKVDQENRTVSGFATLDNDDAHGDVITADASRKAFRRWRGNVREMHQPLAVGKALDFQEEEFYDQETDKFYRGVFVSVYVSKGAEDTWQKVLDGTLSGFSIGGSILEKTDYETEDGKHGRMILDYELKELSLVDSPANKLANIMSIQKDDSGKETVKGMAAETKTQTVYYCEPEGFAFTSGDELKNCRSCGKELDNIGWVEDTIDKSAAVKDLLKQRQANNKGEPFESEEVYISTEGGVDMTKTDEKEETVEKDTTEEAEEVTEVEETEETTKAADVDEVTEEPDLNKVLEQINDTVTKAVEDASKKASEASEEVKTELEKSIKELRDELDGVKKELKSEVDGVKTQVSKFEDGGAVRKSSDVEEDETDDEPENFWRGQFLDAESLTS